MYQQLKTAKENLPSSQLTERLMDILSDPQPELEPKERFLLEYIQLVAYFRLALIQKKETPFIFEAISLKERVGEKLGFSEEDLRLLNVFVRDRYGTEGWSTERRLNEFVNSIGARLRGEES